MNPLRIHLQLIGMAILWGASWPWGEWLLSYADVCCVQFTIFLRLFRS